MVRNLGQPVTMFLRGYYGRQLIRNLGHAVALLVWEPPKNNRQLLYFHAASSSEIRDALKDEELQKLICNIDCSPDAENVSALSLSLSWQEGSSLWFVPNERLNVDYWTKPNKLYIDGFRNLTRQWNLIYSGYLLRRYHLAIPFVVQHCCESFLYAPLRSQTKQGSLELLALLVFLSDFIHH